MKDLFLYNILENLTQKYDFTTQRISFVLPSRRSIYYSKHYLKKILGETGKSQVLPEFLTPEQLIEKITGFIIISKIDLLYYLYISYRKVFKQSNNANNSAISTYNTFIKWAPTLLNDFNDVLTSHPNNPDCQRQFFTNLKEVKEIENWSLSKESLSEYQKEYLALMEKFHEVFLDFNATLRSKGYAYSGLNYDEAVRILQSDKTPEFISRTQQFIFIGFNALNNAEEIIYKYLYDNKKALFYWDYDVYYTDEGKDHEAGKFLKENIKKFRDTDQQTRSHFDQQKTIKIVSATNDVEEALFIKKTLQEIKKDDPDFSSTAIILNAPEKLNLILSAIPEGAKYNISLEYPIFLTPAYQLLIQLLLVFIQQENDTSKKRRIYHKHLISILLNPYFRAYAKHVHKIGEDEILKLVKDIRRNNKIYISIDQDKTITENKHDWIFDFLEIFKHDTKEEIIKNIRKIFLDYKNHPLKDDSDIPSKKDSTNSINSLDINILHIIVEQLNRVSDILEADKQQEEPVFSSMKDVYALIIQVLSKEGVPFQGEPLQGLQIIGLLESRLLEFKNIFIPFMNEGIFPPDHRKVSFIPYDLRKHYHLPTYEHHDAITSYLFYRNLHYPTNIYLSYNNSEESSTPALKTIIGEQSRYIQQIRYELKKDKRNIIKVEEASIEVNLETNRLDAENTLEIQKDEYFEQLKQLTYSPSSITTYLDCSLKFYFQYILKLREEEEITEDLEADVEGNIFHELMQELYKPYARNHNAAAKFNLSEFEKTVKNEDEIKNFITKKIKEKNLELIGKTLIKKEILCDNISRLLSKELEWLKNEQNGKISIIYVEPERSQKNNTQITNHTTDEVITLNIDHSTVVKIKGFPDRIDYLEKDRLYRIVDYKSSLNKSGDTLSYEKLKNISDTNDNSNKSKSINKLLQLLVYVYYAIQKQLIPINTADKISAAILPLKDKFSKDSHLYKYIRKEDQENSEILYFDENNFKEIEEHLVSIFREKIFNTNHSFKQTDNTNVCKYCSFNYICKRKVQSFSY